MNSCSQGIFKCEVNPSVVTVGMAQIWLDEGFKVSVGWQALAFVVLTISEVMVSITGLEFAYTQAPRAMKCLKPLIASNSGIPSEHKDRRRIVSAFDLPALQIEVV